jgi:PTH1 family peptidyl-tRNA hydrolase
MADVRMIVGLGNPGIEYNGTRHNVGFEVIDLLGEKFGADVRKKKFGGLFGECVFGDTKVLLLKPQQYMNRSGQVVATAAGFYKLDLENIIVVTDDMALAPGRIRIRQKGSSGGHNGLGDIIEKLGSIEFARLRIGIGSSGRIPSRDYVLGRPRGEDREQVERAVKRSCEAVVCWIRNGLNETMNTFNVRENGRGKIED